MLFIIFLFVFNVKAPFHSSQLLPKAHILQGLLLSFEMSKKKQKKKHILTANLSDFMIHNMNTIKINESENSEMFISTKVILYMYWYNAQRENHTYCEDPDVRGHR